MAKDIGYRGSEKEFYYPVFKKPPSFSPVDWMKEAFSLKELIYLQYRLLGDLTAQRLHKPRHADNWTRKYNFRQI